MINASELNFRVEPLKKLDWSIGKIKRVLNEKLAEKKVKKISRRS